MSLWNTSPSPCTEKRLCVLVTLSISSHISSNPPNQPLRQVLAISSVWKQEQSCWNSDPGVPTTKACIVSTDSWFLLHLNWGSPGGGGNIYLLCWKIWYSNQVNDSQLSWVGAMKSHWGMCHSPREMGTANFEKAYNFFDLIFMGKNM